MLFYFDDNNETIMTTNKGTSPEQRNRNFMRSIARYATVADAHARCTVISKNQINVVVHSRKAMREMIALLGRPVASNCRYKVLFTGTFREQYTFIIKPCILESADDLEGLGWMKPKTVTT